MHVEREDAEFPGWKWCRAADGSEGWLPTELLIGSDVEAVVAQNYIVHELAVQAGETVEVEEERHKWLLVQNARGERGWIPASHARRAQDQRWEKRKE
ncbi:MAG TPA: SH3 domain-containing protein [Terriglobales bacterium]